MRHLAVAAIGIAVALTFGTASGAQIKKAVGSIELTDPAGDVMPISSSNGRPVPGLDVVKLSIVSDGKQLKIGVTLKDPPGAFATSVIQLYFDTDNNPKTGAKVKVGFDELPGGFEFTSELYACANYTGGGSACVGKAGDKVKDHYAAISLDRYTGADQSAKQNVVDEMGFSGRKASARVPVDGKLIQGVLDYANLGVKPGQTIRILVRESCSMTDLSSFFPEIHLTLK